MVEERKISPSSFVVLLLDPGFGILDPGSGMDKIRIRDKHPGSATLQFVML